MEGVSFPRFLYVCKEITGSYFQVFMISFLRKRFYDNGRGMMTWMAFYIIIKSAC